MKKVESLVKPTTKIQDLNLFYPRCHQTFVSSIGVGDEGHLHILTRWGLSGSCFQLSFNVRRNIPVPWSQGDSHRRLWTTLIIIEKAGQKIAPFWTSMISHSILHKFMLVHFPQKMFNAFFSKGNNSCGKATNNPSPTPSPTTSPPPFFWWAIKPSKQTNTTKHSHPYGWTQSLVESFCQAKARDFLVLTFGDLPQQLLEVSGGVGKKKKGQLLMESWRVNHRYENWGVGVQVIVSIYIWILWNTCTVYNISIYHIYLYTIYVSMYL